MKLLLYILSIILIILTTTSYGSEFPREPLNEIKLNKLLKIEPFHISKNEEYGFDGVLEVENFGKGDKDLIFIAGKYEKEIKKGYSSFVVILRKTPKGYIKEKLFNFYTKKIDNLKYKDGVTYVIFTGESDYFGWIEFKDNEYIFIFNPESNL